MQEVKTHFDTGDIRWYYTSLQAMRGLGWLTLAGAVWLGVSAIVIYAPLPALLSTIMLTLAHALAGVWRQLGWSILVLFVLWLGVVVWLHGLYPSWGNYFRSEFKTIDFRSDWLRSGKKKQDKDGNLVESASDALDGYFVFLNGETVLVVVLVPKGVDGLDIVDHATGAIKAYADGVLAGLHSGSMQSVAGARYWVYRR